MKEVYVNEYNEFYGKEVGCSASIGTPIFGTVDLTSQNGYASTILGNRACLHLYRADNVLNGGCSDGSQYSYQNPIYYRITSYRPRSAAKASPGQKELPSIND